MRRRSFSALALSSAVYLALGALGVALSPAEAARGEADTPVSYTHLTLPTIYSV